jgi:hypothetical protein
MYSYIHRHDGWEQWHGLVARSIADLRFMKLLGFRRLLCRVGLPSGMSCMCLRGGNLHAWLSDQHSAMGYVQDR